MNMRLCIPPACVMLAMTGLPALADAPRILSALAEGTPQGWHVEVTLMHHDRGWDHFASGWEVQAPDGTVIAAQEIAIPRENDAPVTYTLDGVTIPAGIDHVVIRARCSLDGWGASTLSLPID